MKNVILLALPFSLNFKQKIRLLFTCFLLVMLSTNLFSQTQNIITYSTSGLSTSTTSDVFLSNPQVGGFTHSSISNINNGLYTLSTPNGYYPVIVAYPQFNGTSIKLATENTVIQVNGGQNINHIVTEAYQIGYTFLPDYNYFITLNISGKIPSSATQIIGVGVSIGTPQFTTTPANAVDQALSNYGGYSSSVLNSYNSSSVIDLNNNFLANTIYSNYYPISYTGSSPNFFNVNVPSFTVPSSTTGLNIEGLPDLIYGAVNESLEINSVTITAVPLISGPSLICNSPGSYSINQSWPTVWTAQPSNLNLVNINSQGNSATVTKISSGIINLVATVTAPNGASYSVSDNNIQVGAGNPPTINVNYDNSCGTFLQGLVYGTPAQETTGYLYTLTGDQSYMPITYIENLNSSSSGDLLVKPFINNPVKNKIYTEYLTVQGITTCGYSAPNPYINIITVGPYNPTTCNTNQLSIITKDSSSVSEDNNNNNKGLLVSPNPAKNNVKIQVTNKELGATLQIIGPSGNIIYSTTIKNNMTLVDLSNQSSGIYFARVVLGKGTIATIKFIKQ